VLRPGSSNVQRYVTTPVKHSARSIKISAARNGNAARPLELIAVIDMGGHLEIVFVAFARDKD
jgi:hypothetical protein